MSNDAHVPVILGGARTPSGKFRGGLSGLTSSQPGAHAIRSALQRSGAAAGRVVALCGGGEALIRKAAQQSPAPTTSRTDRTP